MEWWARNCHGSFDAEDFDRKQKGYEKRFKKATDQITELEKQKHEKEHKHLVLEGFIKNLMLKDTTLDSFDEPLWLAAIERVIVSTAGQLTFEFKDGTAICR